MMERLTERGANGSGWDTRCRHCDEFFKSPCLECGERGKLFDCLTDYEDAEEQGRLIEFPVAIGDHVWCFPSEAEPYREMQVIGLSCDFGAKYVQVQDVITTETVYFNTENLGRSMFISREQAEAKLKEMEKE